MTSSGAQCHRNPAPVVEAQAPVVEAQAPVVEAQAPVVEAQALVIRAQAPGVEAQAPDPTTCVVCLIRRVDSILSCNHLFCNVCLQRLKQLKQGCPQCRRRFRKWRPIFMG